jgi:hypothetical protein
VDVKPAGRAQAVMCGGWRGVWWGGCLKSSQVKCGCGLAERAVEARWEQQAQVRMPPTARSSRYSACHKGMCIARKQTRQGREGKYMTARYITHLYGLAPAACCSVVMMGFRSCFLRFLPVFWPFDEAALATFLAFSIAAFLMPSEPFMVRRLVDWSGCVGLY